jgi:hypothetical protein
MEKRGGHISQSGGDSESKLLAVKKMVTALDSTFTLDRASNHLRSVLTDKRLLASMPKLSCKKQPFQVFIRIDALVPINERQAVEK